MVVSRNVVQELAILRSNQVRRADIPLSVYFHASHRPGNGQPNDPTAVSVAETA